MQPLSEIVNTLQSKGCRNLEIGVDGLCCSFVLSTPPFSRCVVIASFGAGWDHVSVSLPMRSPTWDEMCEVKRLFFQEDEVAIQYHPASSVYVNLHPFCLHLWRPQENTLPMPPLECV